MVIILISVSEAGFSFLNSEHTLRLSGGSVEGRSTDDEGGANGRDGARRS
jgi:hypothetical protein